MSLPELMCACATVRRASRLVTRRYDQHLREFGLEATQFALLSAVEAQPGKSQVALGAALGLEKATLSRNLRLMETKGWVRVERGVALTEEGRALMARAKTGWRQAHAELQGAMGNDDWEAMGRGLRAMTEAADRLLAS
jgi:DNA-binding MarR family transcriptional regulator